MPQGTRAAAVKGRDRELAAISDFVATVPAGLSVLALVGEAGIGKTRLWQTAVAEAKERGFAVLSCRPSEVETHLPYAALDDLLGDVPRSVFDTLAPPLRHALEVALLRAEPDGPPLQQRAISLATLEVVRGLARLSPIVVAIDDGHWLDTPTAMVLRFALRRLERSPVAVVVAVRTDRGDDVPLGLDRVIVEDRGVRLDVGPLSPAVLGELVEARFGVSLARSELTLLHRQSGGNPLFALEIAGAIVRGDASAALGRLLPVPASLRDLLSDRLFHLPGAVRDLLRVVAALSRPTLAMVRSALDRPADLDRLLERALVAGVIEVEADRIRFSHPLLASVVYADVPFQEQRRLHQRLAEVVTDVEERARHIALSAEGPDPLVATILAEAAERARRRGAPDAAAALGEQAVRFTPADSVDDIHRRTMHAADSHLEAGDTARARQILEELAATTPSGRRRALVWLMLSRVRSYDGGHPAAAEILDQALDEAGTDDELRAHIERDMATAIVQTGDVRRALPHARAALGAAEHVGSPGLLVSTLAEVGMVEFLSGNGIRTDLMNRAVALEDSRPSPSDTDPGFLPTNLIWGGLLKWADDFDEARSRFELVRRRAARFGEESTWGSLLFQLGELELWAGDFAAAERCAQELGEITERSGQIAQRSHAPYLLAAVSAHRGDLAEAASAALKALAEADQASDCRFRIRSLAMLGFIEQAAGNDMEALHYLERAGSEYADAGYGDPGVIRFQPDLIEALIAANQLDRAEALIGAFEARGRALERRRVLALVARCRGLVLAASGSLEDARATMERGVAQLECLPHPFELGRSLLALGLVQRRLRQKRPARDTLERAVGIFDGLGAHQFASRARAECARIGGRASTRDLTPTEAQVAELVGAGCTNTEVSRSLFMSVKTVENTLTRIYRKLGVRSRRELVQRHRSGGSWA